MLSLKTNYKMINAKQYFEEHFSAGDYYSESERVLGQWLGNGAELLGLTGRVGQVEFLRLCDNLHPQTGERLTQRLMTTRTVVAKTGRAHEVANRRIFFDFTFSPPKSVSIAALVGNDPRIVDAHHRGVEAASRELEQFAGTRVHAGERMTDRTTGNIVCAIFRHDTSRALDPHLHSHCIVFNATRDPVEGRWKALQNFEMLRARKYVENVYYHELARDLKQWSYHIVNHPRGDFDIQGVTPELCERFSKRHQEIKQQTRELLAQNPELASGNVAQIRQNVAQKIRARKLENVSQAKLQALWGSQVTETEKAAISALTHGALLKPEESKAGDARAAVTWAEEQLFDRRSVVLEHQLWRHALEHARGQNITLTAIRQATRDRDYIRVDRGPFQITTRAALEREWDIVCLARNGSGRFRPFSNHFSPFNGGLDQDQQRAAEQILTSRDFVTLFRGRAGTGKSFTLREVKKGLRTAGHTLQVLAPQREQVIDLERDGMMGAQTVSEFLTKQDMPRGTVIMVAEAGEIGAKQMQRLLRFVRENHGRVILSVDTRQHGAVEASVALRAIEKYSGLRAAELQEIRRQDPARARTKAEHAQIVEYRHAVKEASEGKLVDSFRRLDRQGAIVECESLNQQERLAETFLELAENNHSVVVVSQTWSEIHQVNDQVRAALRSRGRIGAIEPIVTALEPVDLTAAQKRDRRFYDENSVVLVNRDAGGFRKGQTARLVAITQTGLVLEGGERIRRVPFKFLDRLIVCQPRELALASGDRLQLKANGRTRQGRRLANGELVTVNRVLNGGRVRLQDGRILESDYRQFERGFAITSYASQGKTVDYVLFSDSTIKPATNQQQWYMTISRGRKGIRIFTSDKEQLRENICRSGDRELAWDMAGALRQGMDVSVGIDNTHGIGRSPSV
jgi:conjugative relaxase-like TrwC/TraI family protein